MMMKGKLMNAIFEALAAALLFGAVAFFLVFVF